MKEQVLKQSKRFWDGLEKADTAIMRSVCDEKCFFVHIGGNADLDKEMDFFEKKVFMPTEIALHSQEARLFGDAAVVISDVDYGLLLGGQPTIHHFTTTEVFQKQSDEWKMIQFTFTALVH
ncbi:MAG: nuclear transport factor 2 family protein [Clostridia bacterium]|nr:nuclear transport factor 2 family protein [Clostridia bacterium]